MNQLKQKWAVVLLIASGLSGISAQTVLNVKEKSGTQTSFGLTNVKKLTFTGTNVTVNKTDGSSTDFVLQNVRYLNFGSITATSEVQNDIPANMVLYPNPVISSFQVRYECSTEESTLLQIMDMQGKVVYQQSKESTAGSNYMQVSFQTYKKGIYLCRLQHGETVEIKKFIKY